MHDKRTLTYASAIREAFDIALARDKRVFLIGEGIPDPKGAFGTTTGLQKKFGKHRVMDMPVSENGMTGVCIGAALSGLRPVLTHMRVDFSLYSFDQIVNAAAKWFYMFGGKMSVPIVIRMIIGRGWGQGPQHSQSLQALFAHIPGLKVVMPATPADAKGLLLCAIHDPNPVIYIEHRWLHGITGFVPTGYYTVPIGRAAVMQKGSDITIVADSYATIECMSVVEQIKAIGIHAELLDLRSISPFDMQKILRSVRKTRRVLVVDTGWKTFGIGAEILASVAENVPDLISQPRRISLPDFPTPTSWKLAREYYPTRLSIAKEIIQMLRWKPTRLKPIVKLLTLSHDNRLDTPDPTFTGPF